MKKTLWMAFLFFIACSSCTVTPSDRKSGMVSYTWTFKNSTLSKAIDDIRDNRKWGTYWSFRARNDRKFDRLVLKNIVTREDLLREIKSKIDCEIIEAGRIALIVLPKLE